MSRILIDLGGGGGPRPGHLTLAPGGGPGLPLDPARGLPFPDATVAGIVSERFLETLPHPEALSLLRECRRVLAPEGVLRVLAAEGPAADDLPALAAYVGLEVRLWSEAGVAAPGAVALELAPARPPVRAPGQALVSVVIPAYNPPFFRECLESALGQTYGNLEVIVSDDCPGEGIHEIVRDYLGDPRLRYRRNRPSLGALENFVDSFGLVRGDYVKFMNDDDRLHPTCVERMAEVLDLRPEVTEVTSHRQVIDAQGRFLPDLDGTRRVVKRDSVIEGRVAVDTMLSRSFNFVGHPTAVMFRRADVAEVEPHLFCLGGRIFPWAGDVALSVNLLSRGDLAYLVDTLSYFRVQGNQLSQKPEVIRGCAEEWPLLRHEGARMGFLVPGAPVQGGVRPLRLEEGAEVECDPSVFHPGAAPLAVEGVRAVRLLCLADAGTAAWKGVFQAYLRAFGPADPVTLVVRVDPDPARVEAVCREAEAALREAGLSDDRAPDVVLEASEIPPEGRGGLYTAVSALLSSAGARDGRRYAEARACGLPVVEPATVEELRAVVAGLLAAAVAGGGGFAPPRRPAANRAAPRRQEVPEFPSARPGAIHLSICQIIT